MLQIPSHRLTRRMEVVMSPNTRIDRPRERGRIRGLNLAALGPALVVIVYGFGSPPDATYATGDHDVTPMVVAASIAASREARLLDARMATWRDEVPRVAAPRECVVSAGITEACVFD